IGHAHMDIAYLWPIAQIRQKNGRTYSNVLRLMDKHPDYRFSHSQPQLYQWTKEDFPGIYEGIKAKVAEGAWEPIGGMWVEPDLNMPCGEALVRQIQLGRGWFKREFGPGSDTPVLWLPDTFGFPAQIPQLMAQAGLTYFLTNKVNWNQFNQMPSSTTWWEGLDGSRVLAQFLTTPREVQYLPFPTNYKSDLTAEEVIGTWERNTAKEAVTALPICYGFGDGGGGPTETLIGKARTYRTMPGAPQIQMSTVREAFAALEDAHLPTWLGEIYLEGHRGVLTSQAWIKRANRQGEILLHEAEALGAMAYLAGGAEPADLTEAWEILCLNQFHDILTGTSLSEVFIDAHRHHERIRDVGEAAVARAMSVLTQTAANGASAIVVNTRPFGGPAHVIVKDELEAPCLLPDRIPLPCQPVKWGTLVALPDLPAYATASIGECPGTSAVVDPVRATLETGQATLENPLIRVEIAANGQLTRIFDKEAGRDVLDGLGNQLQAFEDRPIAWDAWDIDPFFEDRMEVIDTPGELTVLETGPLRAVIEVTRTWRASKIKQKIMLWHDSKRIDFATYVIWAERHILVKAAFPVAVRCSRATYEIQFGQVDRPTHRNTSWDWARFEVPAQKWADLSESGYGVALLNDCKYGYDIAGNMMRLSLIKSSTMPDTGADQGG
ncbi:MAG: glycoside hydrolase family 38 C-terminal domain-containing protein, partial [Pseudomonadota bacterium]